MKKRKTETETKPKFEIDDTTLATTPWKRMTESKEHLIELRDNHGFLQILAVNGVDFSSMSYGEQTNLLERFGTFMTFYTPSNTFYTTQLPINTSENIAFCAKLIQQIKKERQNATNERLLHQNQMQEQLAKNQQWLHKIVQENLMNVEYLFFCFGKTPKEVNQNTQKAINYSQGSLNLEMISKEKKEQIMTQFNNMNTKI